MDAHSALLVCCLLAFSSATTTRTAPERGTSESTVVGVTGKPEMSPSTLALKHTSYAIPSTTDTTDFRAASITISLKSTDSTTPFSSTAPGLTKQTGTKAISPARTDHPSTTTTRTTAADSTALATTTPTAETPKVSVPATQVTQTTVNHSLTDTTFRPTTQSAATSAQTTAEALPSATQGVKLANSEKNMTIVFGVLLGTFAVGLFMYMFHGRKRRMQFSHQPLYNTADTDGLIADNDTLVISGGLYDGHPIFDNQPPTTTQQSQFRLEFISEEERIPTF
ncbi:sialomucin core protein 24-like [Lampris incognitus]|uniref:sialomucin core protein 24-like n=1 Tax=Lampris incognitus TaxID=2546036 RepID=UPI0024B57774|nr:sialomucin core protein 24-like [Lampris incognitus]